MEAAWERALELGWESFCSGSQPIGAVVTDEHGHVVAEARSRRHDQDPPPGQLAGTRVAHAELNALAQLPTDAYYSGHKLWATVEPCCLCMGAAVQTGVGTVTFAWRDHYAGATAMVVDNPQMRLKAITVVDEPGPAARWLAGVLVAGSYAIDPSARSHVIDPMREGHPDVFLYAERPDVIEALESSRDRGLALGEMRAALPQA